MKHKTEKHEEYATKILAQLHELFNEDCDNYIDPTELDDVDNSTTFAHALVNSAPHLMLEGITAQKWDALGFNHLANRLCAQFSNVKDVEDEE